MIFSGGSMEHGWWEALTSLQHAYWIIAVAASVALAIQLILVCVQGIEFHMGSDLGAHHGGDLLAQHFQLLTIRNIVAFFAVFGWVGLALNHAGVATTLTIVLSFASGLLMMVIMAAMFLGLSTLQSSGTLNLAAAKGQIAQTYLVIPAHRKSFGKIEVVVQGKKVEIDAVTDDPQQIPTGTSVKVLDIINNQALVERT
jgi:hypothetical protein